MCRSTAAPLLAIIGVAGTAAGVAIAIVRERVDRLSDQRAAKQAAEEQDAPDDLDHEEAGPDSGDAGAENEEPVESGSNETK